MRMIERQFSDLLRRPKEVTQDLEVGYVLLRRRDEPDLRLGRADREAQRSDTFSAFGRALRNIAVHSPEVLGEALLDVFPWLEFLPAVDRSLFLDEFSRIVVASASLDNYDALDQLLSEWKATAEVHSEPQLARRLAQPADASGERVARPGS